MDKNENPTNLITKQFLMQHGIEVFGTKEKFNIWLERENFFFDKKAPIEFTNTDEGLKFINDRLIGIEYGDNA